MAEELGVLSRATFFQSWKNVNREEEEDGQLCIVARLPLYTKRKNDEEVGKRKERSEYQ